jgi:hypothetical protein
MIMENTVSRFLRGPAPGRFINGCAVVTGKSRPTQIAKQAAGSELAWRDGRCPVISFKPP